MKNRIYILLCLAFAACNSSPQQNNKGDTAKSNTMNATGSGPFDLAELKLNENLPELMEMQTIKSEPKAGSEVTLLGFEIFRSTNPKALHFEGADLAGVNGQNKNQVLFHYNEATKALAFYEVTLYNQAQTATLISLLGKVGTMVFKQTKIAKGALEIDEDGNAVKSGSSEGKTFRVWENKDTGLSYFIIGEGTGQSFTAKLIVLNSSAQVGKDWISNLSLNWYQNTKSEPL